MGYLSSFFPNLVEDPVLVVRRNANRLRTEVHRTAQLLQLLFIQGKCFLGTHAFNLTIEAACRWEELQREVQHKTNEIPRGACRRDTRGIKANSKNYQKHKTSTNKLFVTCLEFFFCFNKSWGALLHQLLTNRFRTDGNICEITNYNIKQ